jgi:hypothetical protein
MIKFHGGGESVWNAIEERIGSKTTIEAAIAYLTNADALKLKEGDILICNLSRRALATGSSNPHVAHRLAGDKVTIYSHPDLHAKVIVADQYLFVGSMNASNNSKDTLDEGAIETTESDARRRARSWIRGTIQKRNLHPMSQDDIKKLFRYYRKPKGGGGRRKKGKKFFETDKMPETPTTWYVYLGEGKVDSPEADRHIEAGPQDKALVGYENDAFYMPLKDKSKFQKGDEIIFSYDEGDGRAVWPASVVWDVRDIDQRCWVFYSYLPTDGDHTMTWGSFKRLAEKSGIKPFTKPVYTRLVRPDVAARIEAGWPRPKRRKKKT